MLFMTPYDCFFLWRYSSFASESEWTEGAHRECTNIDVDTNNASQYLAQNGFIDRFHGYSVWLKEAMYNIYEVYK